MLGSFIIQPFLLKLFIFSSPCHQTLSYRWEFRADSYERSNYLGCNLDNPVTSFLSFGKQFSFSVLKLEESNWSGVKNTRGAKRIYL